MPENYTDINTGATILVVRYDELVPTYYKTENYLRKKVSEDMKRGYGMRKVRPGKGQGSNALIEFDSLPLWIQEQMDDPRRDKHCVEMFYRHNVEAERFFANYFLPDGRRIKADIRAKYTANAGAIEAILELKTEREKDFARCGKRAPNLFENLCADATSFKTIQEKLDGTAHNLPENPRRFQEKVTEYATAFSAGSKADKEAAYSTLISEQHISNSIAGARKVHKQELDLFESIFRGIGYKPNYTDVYMEYTDFLNGRKEIVSNETGVVLNPADFEPVSESTIRAYLAKWESKAATLRLRTGDRQKLIGEVTPYSSMEQSDYAGSLLSIDDRQPPFEYPIGTKKGRVWLYLGYDEGAECYTTIVWGKDKNEAMMLDFYRQMVRNYAEWGLPLPAELECESHLNSLFRNTFLREGNMFHYVKIEANKARGKIIERKNGNIRNDVERKDEGWVARPNAKSESNRAGTEKVPMLPFETIVENSIQHYEEWNNAPHSKETGMTRWEFFMTRQNPKLQPINWFGIIPHLGYITKSSCHTGIVRLNHGECLLGMNGNIALGDDLINLMKLAEGRDLDVRWLDGNDGKVLKAYAFIGEEYICELFPKPVFKRARIEQTEADAIAIKLMSSYVATVEGFGNRRKKEIERVTVISTSSTTDIANGNQYHFTIPQRIERRKQATIERQTAVEVLSDNDEFNQILNGNERSFKPALVERF